MGGKAGRLVSCGRAQLGRMSQLGRRQAGQGPQSRPGAPVEAAQAWGAAHPHTHTGTGRGPAFSTTSSCSPSMLLPSVPQPAQQGMLQPTSRISGSPWARGTVMSMSCRIATSSGVDDTMRYMACSGEGVRPCGAPSCAAAPGLAGLPCAGAAWLPSLAAAAWPCLCLLASAAACRCHCTMALRRRRCHCCHCSLRTNR